MLQHTTDERIPDEAEIDRLVFAFYARARQDAVLGPIFARHVSNWDDHLRRISDFWSSVILRSGRYRGRPVPAHLPLNIDAVHFDRWLELFAATAREICAPSSAAIFIERARMIGGSLELAVASSRGVIVPPGDRYRMPEQPGSKEDPCHGYPAKA
jgi:hemoglobin